MYPDSIDIAACKLGARERQFTPVCGLDMICCSNKLKDTCGYIHCSYVPFIVLLVFLLQDGSHAVQVRYESRRRLAETRPRVRGQFVKAGTAAAHSISAQVGKASCAFRLVCMQHTLMQYINRKSAVSCDFCEAFCACHIS